MQNQLNVVPLFVLCTEPEVMAQRWFSSFKHGTFDLNTEERLGRPVKLDEDR